MTFPEPDWQSDDGSVRLFAGDCLSGMLYLPDACVDSVVTDPPYGLGFMGKEWDALPPGVEVFAECLRVLKPGGHLLSFGGSRTYHRMACAVEDAGFEIRDQIMWVYGSGFPKSLDVSKAIDKAAGAEREVVGQRVFADGTVAHGGISSVYAQDEWSQSKEAWGTMVTAPATPEAAQWSGWGTALKPAHEPLVLARKPLTGTVAANVLEHGTGAINVDACRVPLNGDYKCGANGRPSQTGLGDNYDPNTANQHSAVGRWPANFIHDGSDEVVGLFPVTHGAGTYRAGNGSIFGNCSGEDATKQRAAIDCGGSTARFFYCAKASKSERTCNGKVENKHPTVKPLALMRYLVRLITPPGGIVLDPFAGSGTTGIAAVEEGFGFIGFEQDAENFQTAKQRVENVCSELDGLLFTPQLEAAS